MYDNFLYAMKGSGVKDTGLSRSHFEPGETQYSLFINVHFNHLERKSSFYL